MDFVFSLKGILSSKLRYSQKKCTTLRSLAKTSTSEKIIKSKIRYSQKKCTTLRSLAKTSTSEKIIKSKIS